MRDVVQTATRTAFTRIVDAAIAQDVCALLIAGDLFDGAARSAKTAAFLLGQLDRLGDAGVQVFYIKGNHDAENPLTGELTLPAHVHIFDGRGGKVQIGDTNVWVHGVSFSGKHAPESLLNKFSTPVPDAINIGMLHTSLAGAEGHDTYAPCSEAELRNFGYDYWALGHIHKRKVYSQSPWIVMPGIPQGRDIGEAGEGSATLVQIDGSTISASEIPTSAVIFREESIDVSETTDDDTMRALLRTSLNEIASNTSENAILRLTLTGNSARHWELLRDKHLWTETAKDIAAQTGRIWIDKLRFDLKAPVIAGNSTATDELARLMAEIQQEDNFAKELDTIVDQILSELPAQSRSDLLPDPSALRKLSAELSDTGAAQMIALMKGASD
ncbi:metallophosphoesterase [Loktanella sp. S4079]|nr:metallophosphoesterase [Loktanella sp. S4079]